MEHMHPTQNVFLIVGGLITSLGWYCVNIGSVHKFNDATIRSFINSHLSVCASLLSWLIVTYMTRKNFKMTDLLQGIMAGLVGVSACAGSVEVWASLIIGVVVEIPTIMEPAQGCMISHIPMVFLEFLEQWQVGLNSSNTNEALGSYDTSDSSPSSILSKEKEVLHKKLFKAVAAGDLQKLDTLIVKQVSFGVQDFDKRTPL
ncbi:hypothetical protein OS493_027840 [Desmophyllum pertusum]|uniref:Ammonium transporter AmtB-like domain-containing protein n=1 Tax=Desmophyllum pertusum TaxID=174260 RepID=A0A9W9YXG4_9CNID|nr:hypothetical protein OS493_027840 [Desmophyllum pertusum]